MTTKQNHYRTVGSVLSLMAGLLTLVAGADIVAIKGSIAQYAALAAALLMFASKWCEQHVPATRPKSSVIPPNVAGILLLTLFCGCAHVQNLTPGYRAILLTEKTGEATGEALGRALRAEAQRCQAASSDQQTFMTCFGRARDAALLWTQKIVPALNLAMKTTFEALEAAYKAQEGVDWIKRLKPAVCALVKAIRSWSVLLGKTQTQALVDKLVWAEVLACQKD